MPTPAQLRLQDQLARLQGRQTRLQPRVDNPLANVHGERGQLRAANQLLRVQNRLGQVQRRVDNQQVPEGMTPLMNSLLNRQAMLAERQGQLRALQSQGIGGQRFEDRLGRRLQRVENRMGRTSQTIQGLRDVQATPAPPVPEPGPAAPTPTSPVPSGPTPTLADMLGQYAIPRAPGADAAQNFYTQGLSRLNGIETPSYEEQFGRWRDIANREADRQAAAINEAFGARGARYGSDLLEQQGRFRQRMAQDIASQADTIAQGLNAQRMQEVQGLGALSAQQQQMENQRQQNAMQYLFADFLRRTGLPPGLAAGGQYLSSFGPPTNIVETY